MSADFLPLAGGSWSMWSGAVLRGAGFPVRDVDSLGDPALAAAADGALVKAAGLKRTWPAPADLAGYDATFAASLRATSARIAAIASQPLFREAVTWQNPDFVRTCLDRLDLAGSQRLTKQRKQESVIASYVQRYATKNESIGFFGPVGWARWAADQQPTTLRTGSALLARRTVYFESWAIDEVAAAFARRPELAGGLPPRLMPACALAGNEVVRPHGRSEVISAERAAILRLCDGHRTVSEIAAAIGRQQDWLLGELAELGQSGLVLTDFRGPIEAHPERRLAGRLARVPDHAASQEAQRDLGKLVSARDEVAVAAGDPPRLAAALGKLATEFEQLTGAAAVHSPGQAYAGRTVVYEDCARDADLTLGGDVLAALGPPLALVLDSARWLTAEAGKLYLRRLDEHYHALRQRIGADWIPLGRLMAAAAPDFYTGTGTPALAAGVLAELQRRWAEVLAIPAGVRQHAVEPGQIAAAVKDAFASERPQWAGGLRHSPDIMIDASSAAAISRGDFQLVLGEVHTAFNPVESLALVEQCEDKDWLRAMASFATGPSRIVVMPTRRWGYVTRIRPAPDVLAPGLVHWTTGDDDTSAVPTAVIPAGALQAGLAGDDLVVRCLTDQRTFPLAEMIGDYLTQVLYPVFRMLPAARHSPRVTIGRLVVSRETWQLAPRLCDWAQQQDERRRYLQMRQWAARHGLPRRLFAKVPGERKPVYVDLTSLPLTNSLASQLRRAIREDGQLPVTFSEMLPDPAGCWLTDDQGASYCSELRLVVTERQRP